MVVIWVLVADGARARLFRAQGARGGLSELETWVHPESRLHEHELLADSPGSDRNGGSSGRHGFNEPHSVHDQEVASFAREIASRLADAAHRNEFGRLVLCAPPKFLGRLREQLPGVVRERVRHEVPKDLTAIRDLKDLRKRLPDSLYSELD